MAVKVGHTYNQKQHGAYRCEGNTQFHEYAVAVPLLLQRGYCLWPAVRLRQRNMAGITHVLSRLARKQRRNIQGNSQRRRNVDSRTAFQPILRSSSSFSLTATATGTARLFARACVRGRCRIELVSGSFWPGITYVGGKKDGETFYCWGSAS